MELLANSNGGDLNEVLPKEAPGTLATLNSDLHVLSGDELLTTPILPPPPPLSPPSLPPIINGSVTDECLNFNGITEDQLGVEDQKNEEITETVLEEGDQQDLMVTAQPVPVDTEIEKDSLLHDLLGSEPGKLLVIESSNIIMENDNQSAAKPPSPKEVPEAPEVIKESKEEMEDTVTKGMDEIKEVVPVAAILLIPPTLNSVTVTPEAEDEEMEVQSEHNEILQQSSTSKESDLSGDSHIMSSLSEPDINAHQIPTTSSLLVTDQLDVPDVLETVKDLSPPHEEVIPAPSGVASFSLSSVNIPDNALNAPVNMLTRNFPRRHRHVHRAAVYAMHPYHRATCRGGAGVSVAKTLELIKAVLQTSFNQELKKLCDDYLQIFSIAAANINDNTNDTIPDSTLKILVMKMLEEAQQGYQNGKWEFPSVQLPKNDRVSDSKGPPMSTKKVRSEKEPRQYSSNKRRKMTEKAVDSSRAPWRWSLDKRRLNPGKVSEGPLNVCVCVCVDNVDILKSVQKLQRFSVPQFMEKKMKDFVRNVQGYFAQESAAAAAATAAATLPTTNPVQEDNGDK
ncbi:PREDICTED: uncharacterized protein LOC105312495 [Amphimedon queenslandica]|uniref:DNTTIP1 dimerisation domain-containing protein n=1 Tax=Amphimedon queenslandica TaxID=400682 RepID=A0AAN0J331_AMPQE|nr:PREDICTED: uncharacterized protein LOC105312495 [Amphimedon queenslandica]|eukprot:XP_019851143.1 PREDICTED: uncharacterized protein LOC105312495 [Amphimedon queenslandica]